MTQETSTDRLGRGVPSLLLMREFWGASGIVAMWLAVLFDGIYGADFVSSDTTSSTRIPSAIFVAFFAFLATASIAKRAFGPSSRT